MLANVNLLLEFQESNNAELFCIVARSHWGQRTKRANLYAKCKNLADINIKCTVILAQVIALKLG